MRENRDLRLLAIIVLILSIALVGFNVATLPALSEPQIFYYQVDSGKLPEKQDGNVYSSDQVSSESSTTTQFPININTASKDQLDLLPGIGPVKAQAILDYREMVGVIRTFEELLNVSGIGEKTLENILPYIILE